MVLGFGPSKTEDVAALIAKKSYAKAIEVIKAQLGAGRPDPRLRLQLADVLTSAGKGKEAVGVLIPLADEFAREGFAAKAVSVLKRIQKLDPGRRDIESRLAGLIQEKQRVATVALPPPSGDLEIGMEEIGFNPTGGSMVVPARDEMPPAPVASRPAVPVTRPAPGPIVDHDLVLEEEAPEEPELILAEPFVGLEEVDLEEVEASPASPMSDSAFADEVFSLLENALGESPAVATATETAAGGPIAMSPLFKDFSGDELVAVIHGLELLSFDPGELIITQGDPGNSLYILTTGSVKAFVRNASGRHVPVGAFQEGAFFGEGSILTGKPRAATVVAATRCELLELDRKTLDEIVKKHPHVRSVLEQFARQRTGPKGA